MYPTAYDGLTELEETVVAQDVTTDLHDLILWNDDVNTFDWVIESLVEICNHTETQAEQCALIIHYKGKCSVKRGTFEKLRPMCEAFIDRGINATID